MFLSSLGFLKIYTLRRKMKPVRYKTEEKWSVTPDCLPRELSPSVVSGLQSPFSSDGDSVSLYGLWCVFILTSLLPVFPTSSQGCPVAGLRATWGTLCSGERRWVALLGPSSHHKLELLPGQVSCFRLRHQVLQCLSQVKTMEPTLTHHYFHSEFQTLRLRARIIFFFKGEVGARFFFMLD